MPDLAIIGLHKLAQDTGWCDTCQAYTRVVAVVASTIDGVPHAINRVGECSECRRRD